ncbi:MAG: SNF2-related protein [Planctomycetia bacterium]|jgi:SNF2 family DNA or RNA helicase
MLNDSNISTPPKFKDGDEVVDSTRERGLGIVQGPPSRSSGRWIYLVRFAASQQRLFEKDLLPISPTSPTAWAAVAEGRIEAIDAFRRAQAVARLKRDTNTRSTVFSFNAQRVQFQAHQYRPLLKILNSDHRRLLIADEVGLGKTIEAGLILTELDARAPLKRVLVVCPSRLTEKWREELLGKFGYEFDVWGANELRRHAARVENGADVPKLRAIVSLQSLRIRGVTDKLMLALGNLDLLILDESHHVRNPETLSFEAIERVVSGAGAAVFLSATPIQLHRADLFHQFQLLHAQEYTDARQFEMAMADNEGVVQAQAILRRRDPNALKSAAEHAHRAFRRNSATSGSKLVREVIDELQRANPRTSRDWLDLDRRLERLHATSGIMTRARKREVQLNAAVRRSHILPIEWSMEESQLYQTANRGSGSDFARMARERMAASSLWAYLRQANSGSAAIDTDLRSDLPSDSQSDDTDEQVTDMPVSSAPQRDSKLGELLRIIGDRSMLAAGSKALIFTYFVGTSIYLEEELRKRGIPCLRIAGDVPGSSRDPERNERLKRVRAFKEDPSVRVMISTEVGSEGLDFQFCDTLINYDLPWNPMTVEQRIGRLDRFGQAAPVIKIFSLVVKGTIEERVLARLYSRINIFERSIGPLEAIIGQKLEELRRDVLINRLSVEEEQNKIRQTTEAIERQRQEQDDLESQADRLVGHDDYVKDELDRVSRLGRYVTPQAIQTVIEGFLGRIDVENRLLFETGGHFRFRFTAKVQQAVLARYSTEVVNALRRHVKEDMYRFTTEGDVAYQHPELDLVNTTHPLLQVAAQHLEELLEDPARRCGTGMLVLSQDALRDRQTIPAGEYLVATFRFTVDGLGARSQLYTIAVDRHGTALDPESSERLLHLMLTIGDRAGGPALTKSDVEQLAQTVNTLAQEEYVRLDERLQTEADFLRDRRAARIEAEFTFQMEVEERREAAAAQSGAATRMRGLIAAGRQKAADVRQRAHQALERDGHIRVAMSDDPIAICLATVVHAGS